MKNNFKIIIGGTTFLILGIILFQFSDYIQSLFGIYYDVQIIGLLIFSTAGLAMMGIGVMLEFVSRKYRISQ